MSFLVTRGLGSNALITAGLGGVPLPLLPVADLGRRIRHGGKSSRRKLEDRDIRYVGVRAALTKIEDSIDNSSLTTFPITGRKITRELERDASDVVVEASRLPAEIPQETTVSAVRESVDHLESPPIVILVACLTPPTRK